MKGLLLFSICLSLGLHAEDSSSISSKRASYDGTDLVLSGDVQLDHGLGIIQAQNARLTRMTKDGPVSALHLMDEISIILKDREKISCAKADFDFSTLKGSLVPKLGDLIHFSNLYSGLIGVTSKKANVELAKLADSYKVTKIHTQDGVQIQYDKDFILKAEAATFCNDKGLHLSASPQCVLTHGQDLVEAEKIEMYPETSLIVATSPKGHLKSSSFSQCDETEFSCSKLIWEKAPHILTLQGNVHVNDKTMGHLYCDDEVELCQKEENGKWVLSTITTKGKSTLDYESQNNEKHTLICRGPLHLDHERFILSLESPEDLPLEYYHQQMQVTAGEAKLHYAQEEGDFSPKTLVLKQNIRLTKVGENSRCAVADKCTYYPDEKKMVLAADEGKTVLFWDRTQELSMSAKQVHIEHGEKGETIKGVGNVHFVFSSLESELLKKLFPFYKPPAVVKGTK